MKTHRRQPQEVTLLDLLIDGFEKNEVLHGFHMRQLPMPDSGAAVRKFAELADEARRWKGEPLQREAGAGRQLARWADLEIRQAGRGILVQVQAPQFDRWWHLPVTWAGNPIQPLFDWIDEESALDR